MTHSITHWENILKLAPNSLWGGLGSDEVTCKQKRASVLMRMRNNLTHARSF